MASERLTPERRKQLTRSALVGAAREVFARRGFEGASLDEIAETAGFTRGAIYKHFQGKEDLLFAVYDDVNERVLQRFAEQLDRHELAFLDLRSAAAMWGEFVSGDRDIVTLGLEFRLYELRNPSVRERSAAQRRQNRDMIARFVEERAAAAGLRLTVPASTMAAILLTTSDGFAQAALLDPEEAGLYESFLELMVPAMFAGPLRDGEPPTRSNLQSLTPPAPS